jgi:predicted adenylyl cyclase CyaB
MAFTNIEIKVAVSDFRRIRKALNALGATRAHPALRQTDWYFNVRGARLKLRRHGTESGGEVIIYRRPNTGGVRASGYVRLPASDCAGTRKLLTTMFGLQVCVRKRREVWLLKNARIHLDHVDRLGKFVEIEVIVTKGMSQAKALMRGLLVSLHIEPSGLIAYSYAELVNRSPARRSMSDQMDKVTG